jgi:hypothetical protein
MRTRGLESETPAQGASLQADQGRKRIQRREDLRRDDLRRETLVEEL